MIVINQIHILAYQQRYSTVSFARCNAVSSSADLTYNFTITYRRPPFNIPQYSQYQFFLYETIIANRERGKTFDQIAEWLNGKVIYLFVERSSEVLMFTQ